MTRDTALFLLGVLNSVNLNAGAPEFEQAAANIVRARGELEQIINASASD